MEIKWKCIWGVLKPEIVSILLVASVSVLVFLAIKFIVDVIIAGIDIAIDVNTINASQQTVGTVSGLGLLAIGPVIIVLIIAISGLFYLHGLFEELKPCFVFEEFGRRR